MRSIVIEPHPLLRVGVVVGEVQVGPSPEGLSSLLLGSSVAPPPFDRPRETRQPIHDLTRSLLRHCGYRPAGRGKPASEYLDRLAEREGSVPSINNVVDVNNVVSLHSALPISVLDDDLMPGELRIAPGRPGERYVFNSAGQEIDITGLLTVYYRPSPDSPWIPAGNSVKDSMHTKIQAKTTRIFAVIYGHRDIDRGYLQAATDWFSRLVCEACHGVGVETAVLDAPTPKPV